MELEEIEKDVMLIRYYNVLFYLFFEKGRDDLKMQCLVNRIDRGELIRMKQIKDWCHYHQVPFRTRFVYRKEFPIKANCWNLYSYIRFLLETVVLEYK